MREPDFTVQLRPEENGHFTELHIWKIPDGNQVSISKYFQNDTVETKALGCVDNDHLHHFIHHMQEAFIYLESL